MAASEALGKDGERGSRWIWIFFPDKLANGSSSCHIVELNMREAKKLEDFS